MSTKRKCRRKIASDKLQHIVVVSDLHVVCQLVLCPAYDAATAEGG